MTLKQRSDSVPELRSAAPNGPAAGVTLPRQPKQERSRRKQEGLLDAAERLFATRGYDQVTADDIAAAAGYGTGTFYNYFANKTQAFIMVADRHEQAVLPVLAPVAEALRSGGDVRALVGEIVRAILVSKCAVPWLRRTWNRLVLTSDEVAAYHRESNGAWEREVARLLADGMATGRVQPVDPEGMARVLRLLVDSVTDEVVIVGDLDPDVAVESVLRLLDAVLVP